MMLKNALSKFVKGSSRKFKISSFEKRALILESLHSEYSNKTYNPRRARHKSLKGIQFTNK